MAVNDDRLHLACRDNDVDLVERLICWRANVNHTDEHLQTPLMLACHEGHDGVVESLLKEKHIDVNKNKKTYNDKKLSFLIDNITWYAF